MGVFLGECEKLPGQLPRHVREAMLQRLRSTTVSVSLSALYDKVVGAFSSRQGFVGAEECALSEDTPTIHAPKDSRTVPLQPHNLNLNPPKP